MLPESGFYQRKKKKLMFLLVEGRYYNVENARWVNGNYLTLCGVRFPLNRGMPLVEEERNYLTRNRAPIEEFKQSLEKGEDKEVFFSEIKKDLESREDIFFFLTRICSAYDNNPIDEKAATVEKKAPETPAQEFIFPSIIDKDCAAINGRLYPLVKSEFPEYVYLNEICYTIGKSDKTLDDAEAIFQRILTNRLSLEAIGNTQRAIELRQGIREIDEKIGSLGIARKIKRYQHSYEFGNIGYDTSLKHVFWIIDPHYNKNTGKRYEEGQSAVGLPLANKELGNTPVFVHRETRDASFQSAGTYICLGIHLNGNTLEDKMFFLRRLANSVDHHGLLNEYYN